MAGDDPSELPTPRPVPTADDSNVLAEFADLDAAGDEATVPPAHDGDDEPPTLPPDEDDLSVGDLFDERPRTDVHARHIAQIAPPPRRLESGGIDPAFESLFGAHGPAQPNPLALDLDEVERAARFIDDFCGDDIGTTGTQHPQVASDPHEAPTVIPGTRRATRDEAAVYDDTLPSLSDMSDIDGDDPAEGFQRGASAAEGDARAEASDESDDDAMNSELRALLRSFVHGDSDSAPSGF